MKFSRSLAKLPLAFLTLVASVVLTNTTSAADHGYRTIYRFKGGNDGWDPLSIPTVDKDGNLYGTTARGGADDNGTIFKLSAPQTAGGVWKKTILYNFTGGNDGGWPVEMFFGQDGNLYGVSFDYDRIFRLSPPTSHGGTWKYTVLYTLNQTTDGSAIQGIALDAEGNLFGATASVGNAGCDQHGYGCGTVFELERPATEGGKWHFRVLYAFTHNAAGAQQPVAGVTFSRRGNLFGAAGGGTYGYGTIYRLVRPTKKGNRWAEGVLYSFYDPIAVPFGPVTFDKERRQNLYGTAAIGGNNDCGGVFELSPPAKKGGDWPYATLYIFTGQKDGCYQGGFADGNLVLDRSGNIYGTTPDGYVNAGSVFRLNPPKNGVKQWTETTLHSFADKNGDGGVPTGVTWGKWGDLYGVTMEGGICLGCGTVYEVRP
jgi:uncharacterized repeat protein (TIGR03803 family)